MRRRWRSACLLLIGFCAFGEPAGAEPARVDATNYRFSPNRATIDLGQSVTWKVMEGEHTITAEDGSFDSEKAAGDTFIVTFDRPGTFAYYCEYDREVGMTGVIKVRDGAPAASPSPTPTSSASSTTTMSAAPRQSGAPSATTTTTPVPTTSPTTTTTMASLLTEPEFNTAPPIETPPVEAPPETPRNEAAVTAIISEEKEPDDDIVLIAGIGVGVAFLGIAGWAWWHRSSKYLPA